LQTSNEKVQKCIEDGTHDPWHENLVMISSREDFVTKVRECLAKQGEEESKEEDEDEYVDQGDDDDDDDHAANIASRTRNKKNSKCRCLPPKFLPPLFFCCLTFVLFPLMVDQAKPNLGITMAHPQRYHQRRSRHPGDKVHSKKGPGKQLDPVSISQMAERKGTDLNRFSITTTGRFFEDFLPGT
jgi:hypothetical protein